MSKERTQLNINISPELLLRVKSEAIKNGKTLTEFVTEQLVKIPTKASNELLEERLLRIEKHLDIHQNLSHQESKIGTIFTDQGAKVYGETAKKLFESYSKKKQLSNEDALRELAVYLNKYEHSNPELVFNILLGSHVLTGSEMTIAYRKGSCAMRTAISDWCNDPLEELNEAFLNAVITKSLT